MTTQIRFRVRFYRDGEAAVGPGKIELLEAIAKTGSITAAGKALGMSYRRAWVLVAEMNEMLVQPVVATAAGGAKGGGSALTESGQALIARYRRIEALSAKAAARDIEAIKAMIAS